MIRISSKSTTFWKTTAPAIVFFTSIFLSAGTLHSHPNAFYIFLLIGLLLIIYIIISVRNTRHVYFDKEFLYYEIGTEKEKIPLTRIMEINESWVTPRTSTIILKEPCSVGLKIKYIAKFKPFIFTANHPDVIRLYEALKNRASKELESAKKETGRLYRLFADSK